VTVPVKPQERQITSCRDGLGNTRARRTNTANRAPNMPMHRRHVTVHICTISIMWNFHTTAYYPSEQQSETTG
jgi:hypothetical protein